MSEFEYFFSWLRVRVFKCFFVVIFLLIGWWFFYVLENIVFSVVGEFVFCCEVSCEVFLFGICFCRCFGLFFQKQSLKLEMVFDDLFRVCFFEKESGESRIGQRRKVCGKCICLLWVGVLGDMWGYLEIIYMFFCFRYVVVFSFFYYDKGRLFLQNNNFFLCLFVCWYEEFKLISQ